VGLALDNNQQIELPLAPVLYKLLLGQEPCLADLHQWQPETAKSLQFILDYQEANLEDVICRNFSVDLPVQLESGLMSTTEVDLVPNGRNIPVTI
jgi:hypothetical protein